MALSQKKRFWQPVSNAPKKELQLRFLRRLSRLLNNGYPIIQALEIIQWDSQLKSISSSVMLSLKSGKHFDEALEAIHFKQSITAYLYFVRSNGDLNTSIEKCISMFEQRLLYMKKFQETIRYPLILLLIFAVLLYFVKQSVLPSFVDLFQNSAETASAVMLTMAFIDIAGRFIMIASLILGIGFLIWRFQQRKISIDKRIKFYSLIPIYRHYKTMEISFLFAAHLSSLLTTGLSIKEILVNMARQKKQPILAYYASLLTSELSKGIYVTNLLANLPLIDKQISVIFQKNSDTEALEKDLSVYAEFQTEEMHRKVMKIITYIQPIFFLILASLIIFIYMALMWPMFQLINTI
ncbi:competence type IV pilus assembly protein ComGB [Lentibacillus sp. CBA3610]|uniref:competence type IV pilus assembly protein ComGB n=1 Tax=Lentibacillus sp. CBA3610 TaxID=2518176 RepID=UPI0015957F39|nr:competence type IV pilus assembly protein ComGB [Lentibacillus sp. CBA3610]QKY69319.1 chromosome partitioning protein ParA [Lentibacillus sp. CBA3610]